MKSRRMASVENQALSFPTASQTSGAVDLGDGPIRRRRALDGRSVQRLMPSLLPSLQTRHGSLFGSDNEMDARTISRSSRPRASVPATCTCSRAPIPQWIEACCSIAAYVQTGDIVGGVGTRYADYYHLHFAGASPKVTIPIAFQQL